MYPEAGAALPLSLTERRALWILFAIALAARLRYAFIFRVDSDEPQHLHIVWAWTQGLVPYRDVFDNHAPLFHILCAPFFHLLGERADALLWMRVGMTLCAALCAWCIYWLGKELYSPRAGLWAALLAMLEKHYFYTSTEFRTDDLWAAGWLLLLVTLVAGRGRPAWLLLSGLLLGITFSVSLKTSLLVASLLASWLVLAGLLLAARQFRFKSLANLRGAAAFVAGLVPVPALLWLFFWHRQALEQARYCLVEHNIVPGLKRWGALGMHEIVFAVAAPLLVAAAWLLYRGGRQMESRVRTWRVFFFLIPGFYYALLWCFWPDLTREDNLPFSPLVMLNVTPALLALGARLPAPKMRWLLPVLAALFELYLIASDTKPWHNDARRTVADYATILRLTRPGDYVMDEKSGGIFRPRPFYMVLETITRYRMKLGLIKDDIAEHLVATRCAVVEPGGFPRRMNSRVFVIKNYLPLANTANTASEFPGRDIWVLGQDLGVGGAAHVFAVAIPGNYSFIQPDGRPIPGRLDGRPLAGPAQLAPGIHTFTPAQALPDGHILLFWEKARQKGYLPSLARWVDFIKDSALPGPL